MMKYKVRTLNKIGMKEYAFSVPTMNKLFNTIVGRYLSVFQIKMCMFKIKVRESMFIRKCVSERRRRWWGK